MTRENSPPATVGVIGLGAMGSVVSVNLAAAGFEVLGYDVDETRHGLVDGGGVTVHSSVPELARRASVLITSLPSVAALEQVVAELAQTDGPGRALLETSTLPVHAKQAAATILGPRGITVLDTPISGTAGQARTRDLAVYASGDREVVDACRDVVAGFARSCHYVGDFGAGMAVKLAANLLVSVHNVVAAEALLLGSRAGVDPQLLLEVLTDGAGTSRMLEVRGPLMLSGTYEPATASIDMFTKDLSLIAALAAEVDCPVPVLSETARVYAAAKEAGRGGQDAASVMAVLEQTVTEKAVEHEPR